MKPTGGAIGMIAGMMVMAMGTGATAQVRDAVYRGTLVCDKLPFMRNKMREAIDVTISGETVSYTHVVRVRETPEGAVEKGTGKVNNQAISLEGAWKGDGREYRAKYSGTFVRRSAKLTGTQSWTEGGKTFTRTCAGAIKRPLRAFLPRAKKP